MVFQRFRNRIKGAPREGVVAIKALLSGLIQIFLSQMKENLLLYKKPYVHVVL